jgi:hypothetical protein
LIQQCFTTAGKHYIVCASSDGEESQASNPISVYEFAPKVNDREEGGSKRLTAITRWITFFLSMIYAAFVIDHFIAS